MGRNVTSVLFVALLVVTAGCAGGGLDPSAVSGDREPADVGAPESDGATTGGDGAMAGADGTMADESADGATLAEDRMMALEAAGSYTSTWRMRTYEGETQVGETAYVTAMDYANERYSFEVRTTSDGAVRTSGASYYADGTAYQRLGEGDEVTYAANAVDFASVAQSGRAPFVSTAGDLEDFAFVGTETYDGVAVKRYEMTKTAPWLAAQQSSDEGIRWTDFSYVVLVDGDGLVRSEHWRGTGVDDAGAEHTVEFTYELTQVGSTDVPEPAWLDAARA